MKINDIELIQSVEINEEIQGAGASYIPFIMSPFAKIYGTDIFSGASVNGQATAVGNDHLNKYTAVRFETHTDENVSFSSVSASSGIGARLWNHRT